MEQNQLMITGSASYLFPVYKLHIGPNVDLLLANDSSFKVDQVKTSFANVFAGIKLEYQLKDSFISIDANQKVTESKKNILSNFTFGFKF